MTAVVWTVEIDTNDDFQFASTYAGIVLRARLTRGISRFWSRTGMNSGVSLRLSNVAGYFTPLGSSPLVGGRFIRLVATVGAVPYILITALVDIVRVSNDGTFVDIEAEGRLTAAASGKVWMPLMTEVTGAEVITEALTQMALPQPLKDASGVPYALVGGWVLGTDVLGAYIVNYSLDTSLANYEVIGEQWNGATGLRVIDQIVTAEWGVLLEMRDGAVRFYNRHSVMLGGLGATHVLPEKYITGQILDSGVIINEVTMRVQERETVPDTVVWTALESLRFEPGYSEREVVFTHTDGRVLAAEDVQGEVMLYDARTGGNLAGVAGWRAYATGVRFTVLNETDSPQYIQVGAELRGTARILGTSQELRLRDQASIVRRGRQPWFVPMPAFADAGDVFEVAKIGLRYATPAVRLLAVDLHYDDAQQVTIELLDEVTLDLTRLGVGGTFWVAGISHDLERGRAKTTLWLRPKSDGDWLIVGDSTNGLLDSNRVAW